MTLRAALSSADAKAPYVRRLFHTIAGPLRPHHRAPVVRPRPPLEGDGHRPRRRARRASARSISPPAPATSPSALAARGARVVGARHHPSHAAARGGEAVRLGGRHLRDRRHDGAAVSRTAPSTSSRPATASGTCPAIEPAIAEIRRVLRPGGLLLSLDFDRPANPIVRCGLSGVSDAGRFGARLGPASRPRHLSLHSRVDPALSGSRRCRRDARPRGLRRQPGDSAARWFDGDQRRQTADLRGPPYNLRWVGRVSRPGVGARRT